MREMKDEKKRCGNQGFTLIEILLVVVIIGVLAALGVPKITGHMERSRVAAAKSDISAISTAISMYEMDNGKFPASLEGLETDPGGTVNWLGPYMENGLPDDPWGKPYDYKAPGSHNPHKFDLSSQGSSKSGVIGNWKE